MIKSDRPNIETLLLVIGGMLTLFFFYTINQILTPVILFISVLFIFYPYRSIPPLNRILWLTVMLFILWFLISIASVCLPFIIAFLLAYLLNPLVNRLENKKIKRWVATLLILAAFMTIITLLLLLSLPPAIDQFKDITENVSSLANQGVTAIREGALNNALSYFGISGEAVRLWLENELPPKLEVILRSLLEGIFGFLSNISAIITQVINIVIIPFITFYLLKDFPVIMKFINTSIPVRYRDKAAGYFGKVDEVLSDYLRGAIIVALIQGSISTLVLSILGVRYALVLGIMTALLDFIPYVGLIICLVVSVIAATFSGDPVNVKVIGVIVMYLTQKILENSVLAPKIIGSKIGVHPVLLIASLFIFSYFFGFVGLLIAVPLTAIIVMSAKLWLEAKSVG